MFALIAIAFGVAGVVCTFAFCVAMFMTDWHRQTDRWRFFSSPDDSDDLSELTETSLWYLHRAGILVTVASVFFCAAGIAWFVS